MATTTSFKQECPSCEAQVPIKDASLVGRKIDCPKCKFRFVVEKPPVAEESAEDAKPAKNTKVAESKVTTVKTTNGKPANGKPANGKVTNGKAAPDKPANGKAVAEKTTSDKVTAKTAPAAKNGKTGLKKLKDEDEATPKKKKKNKSGGGSTRIFILGGILGVLAVIGLIVAIICFWPSGGGISKGGTPGASNNPNNPGPKPGGEGGDKEQPGEKDKEKPPAPPSIADISNILPNNTEVVIAMNTPGMLSSSLRKAAFLTPGAFQDKSFAASFGFSVDDVQRVILALIPSQNGVFSVMRTTKPIARDKLTAGLKLETQPPVNGLNKYLVKAHLDSLSNFLVKSSQAQDPQYVHIADDYTLVFANQAVMDQFLGDNARPKFLTQTPSSPPPDTTPKPPDMGGMGKPNPTMPNPPMSVPPMPGVKMSAIVNPDKSATEANEPSVEIYVREADGQFVAFQPGRPGGPGGPGGNPNPMPGPGGGPNPMPGPGGPTGGPNPMPGQGGPGGNPNPMPGPGGPGGGPNPMPGPGGPGGRPGPGGGPNPMPGPGGGPNPMPGPGGGPNPMPGPGGNPNPMPGPGGNPNPMPGPGGGPNPMPGPNPNPNPPPPAPKESGSYMTLQPELKGILDKVESQNKQPAFIIIAAYGRSNFAAEIGQRMLDAIPRTGTKDNGVLNKGGGFGPHSEQVLKSKVDPFRDVQLVAISVSELRESKLQATLALEGRDDRSRAELEKTVREFGAIMPYFFRGALASLDVSGIPSEQTTTPNGPNPNPYPTPGGPMSTPGNPGTGSTDMDPDLGKGRDGALTLTKVDNALVLALELNLKPAAYSIIMAKMEEFCVQLKSQGELVDARSHVHELAAALQAYVKENNAFPPGTVERPAPDDRKIGYPPNQRLSWMTELLPYLTSSPYRKGVLNPKIAWSEGDNLRFAQVIVPEFLARTRADQAATVRYPNMTTPLAATHFVGVSGLGYDAADYRADDPAVANKLGVFGYDRVTKVADVKGGLDKTIVLLQIKPENAAPWIVGGGSTVRGVSDDASDPSAVKPFVCMQYDGKDGTVAIMGDGKVRFIPATIPNKDFRGLCAINGGKPANLDMVAPEIPPPDDASIKAVLPPPGDPKPVPPKEEPKPAEVKKPPQGWQDYSNKDMNFSVFFPEGKIADKKTDDPKTKQTIRDFTVVVENPRISYTVTILDPAPEAKVLGATLLDYFKEGVKKDSKVNKETKITLDGHPGVELEVVNKNVILNVRVYYVAGRIYSVMVGFAADSPETAMGSKTFLESFRLVKAVAVEKPPSDEWKELASKEGRFTVQMPANVGKPETKKDKGPFGELESTSYMAMLLESKQMYAVAYMELPANEAAKGADAVFGKVKDEMMKAEKDEKKKPKVTSEKKLKQGDAVGVEYRIKGPDDKNPDKTLTMVLQLYLAKNRLYTVMAFGLDGPFVEKDAKKFLDSFKLTDGGGAPKPISTTEPPPGWKPYTPNTAKFGVYFPSAFEMKTTPNGPETMNVAGIQQKTADSLGYVCQWVVKQQAFGGPEAVAVYLKGTQEGSVKASKGKLLDEKEITQDGVSGREFLLEVAPNRVLRSRIFVVETQVVSLQVWGKDKDAVNSKDADQFFASFKVTSTKPK